MLLEGDERGWRSTVRRVAFAYGPIFREFERLGFVEECGIIGQLCVNCFTTARPQDGVLRWKGIHYPDTALSRDMYAEYSAKCKWWEYSNKAYHVNM
jgi:hypothetical protein